jgi:hypothetical protein
MESDFSHLYIRSEMISIETGSFWRVSVWDKKNSLCISMSNFDNEEESLKAMQSLYLFFLPGENFSKTKIISENGASVIYFNNSMIPATI